MLHNVYVHTGTIHSYLFASRHFFSKFNMNVAYYWVISAFLYHMQFVWVCLCDFVSRSLEHLCHMVLPNNRKDSIPLNIYFYQAYFGYLLLTINSWPFSILWLSSEPQALFIQFIVNKAYMSMTHWNCVFCTGMRV